MKRQRTLVLALFFLLGMSSAFAQSDLLDKIFDQEEPVFQSSIIPTKADGAVKLAVYFTHSKIDALEASFWIVDNGANLSKTGAKKLVRGLQGLGNRQQDTILIQGLVEGHYYSIGIDYRNQRALSRKFATKPLHINYFYQPTENQTTTTSPQETPQPTTTTDAPCTAPELFVRINPDGHCGADNRPAVLIQCESCPKTNWEFSVETRTAYGEWQPLRADGQRQQAMGNAVRTEPLCVLPQGEHYIRVLAWGENCAKPVIQNIATPVKIQENTAQRYAKSGNPPLQSVPAPKIDRNAIPDTCVVDATARLEGNMIRGTLELAANSPCGTMEPYAMVKYVHPGFRDIELDPIPLNYGIPVPFEIRLTSFDLERGIHPMNVTTFVKMDAESLPTGSFWVRTSENAGAVSSNDTPQDAQIIWDNPEDREQAETQQDYFNPSTSGEPLAENNPQREMDNAYESSVWEEDIETVRVTASDPNCTQIQDLQVVYNPRRPEEPLYISWLNPRCCQEEGCEYTVWTGAAHDQLSLLIKGRKQGATIREVLQGLDAKNKYFEVVVKTPNGNRKAAYIPGEGAKYGFEEILGYQDKINAPKSDTIVYQRKGGEPQKPVEEYEADATSDHQDVIQVRRSTAPGFRWDDETTTAAKPASLAYTRPSRPITDFEPCKIQRTTTLDAEQPILAGDKVTISYDYNDPEYRFTLYQLPENVAQWVIAPGTEEGQKKPVFELDVQQIHSGKYLILSQKADGGWGCLSDAMSEAIEIQVKE